jgi:trk system potassium uptake protein TrkA
MKIIINGCGKIGKTILSNLVSEGHDVVAIDNNRDVVSNITDIYDVMGVCGNGADNDVLAQAGIKKAELFVSVTGSDELNMLSCFMAKRMGAKHTIARIRNPEYNDDGLAFMRKQLDISLIINPELMAAHELYNILKLPSAAKVERFSVRNFEMIELKLKADSVFDGVKISDLRSKFESEFLVCAVQRGEDAYIPDGNFVLKSGDKIAVTAKPAQIIKLFKEMGIQQNPAKKIMILGAGRTAYYLAKKLSQINNEVIVVEKQKIICEEFCEALPKVLVVNGDGSDREILNEEGLNNMDAFVSLTGMDEQNILISSYAASQNVPKVIAKINREELMPLAENLGLDTFISPKKLISDLLVKYARALENSQDNSMETLYKVMDDKVEVLEFLVKENRDFIGITFKELTLKPNILIAGIVRDKKIIIPSGDDMMLQGDKVIVLAANQRINDLSDIVR